MAIAHHWGRSHRAYEPLRTSDAVLTFGFELEGQSVVRLLYVKVRYPCSGLAPVAVFQWWWGFQAALMREGRPPALANAPFSRDRSWRIGCTFNSSPPAEISTVSPTIATWTWRRACCLLIR